MINCITRPIVFLVLCLACLLTVGCRDSGPQLGTVSGTITLEGEPLPNAKVLFQPGPGGSPSEGRTDSNGKYELQYGIDKPGALVGEHVVRITTYQLERETADGPLILTKESVPAKYNEQSELTREVKPGHNELNFELEPGPLPSPPE